ncbi:hypothetical protein VNO78_31405 [Psophocarpus tetragonolobus]|uniref:Uncharacterized protein n=1 Tax=Psophocarpus tetragonolobus TaxID=3891 RepID=A0AAN9X7L6_PSOTE
MFPSHLPMHSMPTKKANFRKSNTPENPFKGIHEAPHAHKAQNPTKAKKTTRKGEHQAKPKTRRGTQLEASSNSEGGTFPEMAMKIVTQVRIFGFETHSGERERKGRVFAIYKGVPTKLDMAAEERESERRERVFDKKNRNRSIIRTFKSSPLVLT